MRAKKWGDAVMWPLTAQKPRSINPLRHFRKTGKTAWPILDERKNKPLVSFRLLPFAGGLAWLWFATTPAGLRAPELFCTLACDFGNPDWPQNRGTELALKTELAFNQAGAEMLAPCRTCLNALQFLF